MARQVDLHATFENQLPYRMNALLPSCFRYRGKARPSDITEAASHLLPYHCLDVAAVAT